jgi:dTDP-L-rhamnose 4-epimerase
VRKHVLITGGAGYVGSHLADELLLHGYQVGALDNLSSQVHGLESKRPEYLSPDELVTGDIRDHRAEALACGIPLISSYWHDSESLFTRRDYLVARNGQDMKRHIRALLENPLPRRNSPNGRQTILQRHTCAHRAEALLSIYRRSHTSAEGVLT